MRNLTTTSRQLGSRAVTVAAVAGIAFSAAAFTIPAVASAAPAAPAAQGTPATQTYDIWNLTSTDIKVTGYEKPSNYKMAPNLPTETVIPIGKNLQITVPEGYGVITDLSGARPAQQGGTQAWQVATHLEASSEWLPAPIVHMACIPTDGKNAACGVSSGSNVKSLADAPGTRIAVPASDVQTQAMLMANLCNHPYAKTLQIKCIDFSGEKQVTAGNTVWTWPAGR